jgi:hypothetical protein
MRVVCPVHHIALITTPWRVQINAVFSNLYYLLSLLGPNILFITLFSDTLNLGSSFRVRDQDSYSDKTTGKIIFLYILILKFL